MGLGSFVSLLSSPFTIYISAVTITGNASCCTYRTVFEHISDGHRHNGGCFGLSGSQCLSCYLVSIITIVIIPINSIGVEIDENRVMRYYDIVNGYQSR